MNKYNSEKPKSQNCWYVATRLLGIRPRSVGELKKKLLDKKFSETEVTEVVNNLLDLKYLNDEEFARVVCRSVLAGKPRGKAALKFKLKKYLVSDSIIKKTLEEFFSGDQEEEYCRKALEKKRKTLKKNSKEDDEDFKTRQKLFGYLMRQGFSPDVIYKVMK